MQFLMIDKTTRLSDLADYVHDRNVESVLAANNLPRVPDIGYRFYTMCQQTLSDEGVTPQRKSTILNTMTQDSDVFETAALLSESGWKVFNALNTFPNALRLPDNLTVSESAEVIGNGIHISNEIYDKVMNMLDVDPYLIDPVVFNEYSTIRNVRTTTSQRGSTAVTNWFNLPWGLITLYSSLSNSSMDFPVFPESPSDGVVANYTTMPDMLYQYEPWYVYQSSGPRSNTYTFKIHRDMFSGDHNDGRANELIRFCEANCFPNYDGASVSTATVTLYINGSPLITGIMTQVNVSWDGPIGHDNWYLYFTLELSITEVSDTPLNYTTVMNKPLIG